MDGSANGRDGSSPTSQCLSPGRSRRSRPASSSRFGSASGASMVSPRCRAHQLSLGRLGFNGGRRNIYGDQLALLAQLEIDYDDGTSERIVTDETWHATRGPILANDLYDGETYDARLERPGWSKPAYDDHDWTGVRQ